MTRLAYIPNRIIDHNGIADGATVHVYLSGSTTPVLLYSNSAMTTPLANPFTVAAGASFPDVFYDSSVNIKLTIVSALDGSIEEHDPYNPLSISVSSPFVSVKVFGATGDGVTDDSAAFIAAIAALRAYALNTGGSGFYKGSPKLYVPAGHYYMGTTSIDINHTLIIEGDGSGREGPGASGCTHLRWAAGTSGLRVQHPNTNGDTGVDDNAHTHDGAAGVTINNLCLEGAFTTTEGEFHGLVCRGVTLANDVYIKNWQGEGVKLRAGNQTGGGTLGGNVSGSRFIGVKTEGCRIGFDTRGADANVVSFFNCNGYQNRQANFVDDNGAGSNTYIGCHAASGGLITGTWPQTQCSYSGNHYALKWGGDPTVAPSGDTTDTANWLYIEAGGVAANLIPAWVNTPNTFRAGGDYVAINQAGVHLVNCYSENGGFSQFTNNTGIDNGTITNQYFRGGSRLIPGPGGLSLFLPTGGNLNLSTRTGEIGVFAKDETTATFGYLDFLKAGDAYLNGATGVTFRHNGAMAGRIDTSGLSAASVTATGTGGVGYGTGAGGAVTQATSRVTGVTLNKSCGAITLFSAAGSATYATMTVTNSQVAATDTVRVCQASGTDKYMTHVTHVGAGSFDITFATTGGTTTETPVFNFSVIKGVTS